MSGVSRHPRWPPTIARQLATSGQIAMAADTPNRPTDSAGEPLLSSVLE